MNAIIPLMVLLCIKQTQCFLNGYGKIKQVPFEDDPGQPLYLTPYIEQGNIEEARKLSTVNYTGFHNVRSYSGYLTVNKEHGSNMFFWYFPSVSNADFAPVVLWLQGGPGATSLIGLFTENGPFEPVNEHKMKLRKYSWSLNHHLIYIDNPVGTGYSFTKDKYAKDETDVGTDLYEALLQFFSLFPDLQNNEFYVSGESYAGKYVPAVSYMIHKNNPTAKLRINLQGLAIGNGFSDPEHQLNYGDYLYQIGLVDGNMRQTMKDIEKRGVEYIKNKQWIAALKLIDDLLDGDMNHTSVFKNVTGFDNYYNYLIANDTSTKIAFMGDYIQSTEIRKAIHVGNATFNGIATAVQINLIQDFMQSITPWITELLLHYNVVVYNGQLDIIVAYPLTVNYLNNLNFSGAEDYKTAKRYIWMVDGDVAGYVKHAGNLTEVLVRNAGHMVPSDQPKWAYNLITHLTHRKSFY